MMAKSEKEQVPAENAQKKCGIIMPISGDDKYSSGHWQDVLSIITESFDGTEFQPNLVSRKDSVGLIHESIVTNIYSNDIVICDVSSRNPNVMFELGLRLAFDKPVIIIKDELTPYSFDTGPIEHLPYPSSLRFRDIVYFKEELRKKAIATYEYANKEPGFSPYLKSFNKAIVSAKIENVEVTDFQFLVDKINEMSSEIADIKSAVSVGSASFKTGTSSDVNTFSVELFRINLYREFIKNHNAVLDSVYNKLVAEKTLSKNAFRHNAGLALVGEVSAPEQAFFNDFINKYYTTRIGESPTLR